MDGNPRQALAHLSSLFQRLSSARDLGAVMDAMRHQSRALTGADGATFVLRDGDACVYAEEEAIAPLWKGQRFPLDACISGWAMLHGEAAIVPDVERDPRIPFAAYKPTFVRSLAVVPIGKNEPIGAIGHYWADCHQPTGDRVTILQAVADVISVALENGHVRGDLDALARQNAVRLAEVHARLATEIRLRREAEDHARRLLQVDVLTGLCNRSGFLAAARQALDQARRAGRASWLVMADVDGLRTINERDGSRAGDRVLGAVAESLRQVFAGTDLIGRTGDGEFSVFGTGSYGRADRLLDELQETVAQRVADLPGGVTLSVGSARCAAAEGAADFEVYLRAASHALSVEKAARRLRRR